MEIQQMVTYLCELAELITFHEKLGNGSPNKWIVAEFNEVNNLLLLALKDKHDETRQS